MKKILVILSLGLFFSCQEAIEPEVVIEEVESTSADLELEVDLLVEVAEEIEIEEVLIEEAIQKIKVNLAAKIEEIRELEIVEIQEDPRKN